MRLHRLPFSVFLPSLVIAVAQRHAAQLIENFPASPRIHNLAGLVEYKLRHYAEAERHLNESQRLHAHWKTRLWIGKTLTQIGRFEEAEAILLDVLPHHPDCRLDLAWLFE